MKIVTVVSTKGGPGKSTTSVNLAAVFGLNHKVALIDTDTQGSTWDWCSQVGEALPFDYDLSTDPNTLARIRSVPGLDVVIVDTPGHDRDVSLLQAILLHADYAVVVAEPAPLQVRPLLGTISSLLDPRSIPYRVLLNRVDASGAESTDVTSMRRLLTERNVPYFDTVIRQYAVIRRAPAERKVATMFGKDSSSQNALADFKSLAVEILADWRSMERDPDDQGAGNRPVTVHVG